MSLKILFSKSITIQKFTGLALRHWMAKFSYLVAKIQVTTEENRLVWTNKRFKIISLLGLKNCRLWIETGRWVTGESPVSHRRWPELWISIRCLWNIQLPWGTNLALFFVCKEDSLWKVFTFQKIISNDLYMTRLSYDGFLFHNQESSKTGHYFTTLAKIGEAPLAVGGSSPVTNKAEILDIFSDTWTEIAEYPYHD